jgi:hypothetical protein
VEQTVLEQVAMEQVLLYLEPQLFILEAVEVLEEVVLKQVQEVLEVLVAEEREVLEDLVQEVLEPQILVVVVDLVV